MCVKKVMEEGGVLALCFVGNLSVFALIYFNSTLFPLARV
jgi:hypothetical protein